MYTVGHVKKMIWQDLTVCVVLDLNSGGQEIFKVDFKPKDSVLTLSSKQSFVETIVAGWARGVLVTIVHLPDDSEILGSIVSTKLLNI